MTQTVVGLSALLVLVLTLMHCPASGRALSLRSITSEGPPPRPEKFGSVDELNQYLAALTEYYTVLGRPRFGKRSMDLMMNPHQIRYTLSDYNDVMNDEDDDEQNEADFKTYKDTQTRHDAYRDRDNGRATDEQTNLISELLQMLKTLTYKDDSRLRLRKLAYNFGMPKEQGIRH